jgi:hypothetical protein
LDYWLILILLTLIKSLGRRIAHNFSRRRRGCSQIIPKTSAIIGEICGTISFPQTTWILANNSNDTYDLRNLREFLSLLRFTKIKKAGLEKPDFSDLHRPPRFFIALEIGPLNVHTSLKLKMKIDFAKE